MSVYWYIIYFKIWVKAERLVYVRYDIAKAQNYLTHYNYNVILHYKISREKFEPEPGFEPRTSGFLARRSTT